ncbi:MAG: V-type ATP synthase subunit A, partial [Pseudomonadota bacterium]
DELARIVNLVGPEALSSDQRWVLEGARLIREGILQQSALDEVDAYAAPQKQFTLMDLMFHLHRQGNELLKRGIPVEVLLELPVMARARRLKSTYSSEQVEQLAGFADEVRAAFARVYEEYQQVEPQE